ncbi:helix-turn-helix domain-containing protein [Bacillus sp. EB01]|uniref:helix-turn-helix domain-containing protein n=1 Tax=Bacillus sp. EB01 TaxID=1347086 RepID=UPI0005C61DA4|nr:helix-turn-helix domain-containing protein [Bacillus sp. EB01]
MTYTDFIKIAEIVCSVTKIDAQLVDQDGTTLFDSANLAVPAALNQSGKEDFFQIKSVLNENQPNLYYLYINTYGLEYVATGVWREKTFRGYLIIGPFLSSMSVIQTIKDSIAKNKLPISERKQLEQYYQSLPVLSEAEYTHLGELIVNLCGQGIKSAHKMSSVPPTSSLNPDKLKVSIEENQDIIEARYELQGKIMEAVAKGNKTEVQALLNSKTYFLEFSDRVPGSPIRSSKNMAIVMNTMFRIAAERSGIHPVYLHTISERFAILIERTMNIPQLQKLMVLMGDEYCELVKTYSTGSYSPTVKRAADFIQLNLGHSITLEDIAKQLNINPSHLSRIFKEDTGLTITDFINRKRIDEAKLYLQRGTQSITEIAFLVGFNDLNYFSKVFKKLTSVTPSQYAKKRKHK